jgi:hypothetical protein
MAHELLLHFERSPSLVKKTPEGVAERAPADVADARADGRAAVGIAYFNPQRGSIPAAKS